MPPESCPANSGALSDIDRIPVRIKSESVSECRRNTHQSSTNRKLVAIWIAKNPGSGYGHRRRL